MRIMNLDYDFPLSEKCDLKVLSKPRKPLSAYNLFFRFERSRILRASELDCISFLKGKDGKLCIVRNKNSKIDFPDTSSFPIHVIRDQIQRESSRKTKRHNKKAHGKISFTDMIHYMCKKWNNLDKKSRDVFNSLAAEEKEKYAKQLMAYNKARYDSVKDVIGVDGASREHYDAPIINKYQSPNTSTTDDSESQFSLESKTKLEETESLDAMHYKKNECSNDSKLVNSNETYPNSFSKSRTFQTKQQKEKRTSKDNLYMNRVKLATSPSVSFEQTMIELEKIFRQRPIKIQSLSVENKLEYSLKYREEKDLAHFLSEFDWHTF